MPLISEDFAALWRELLQQPGDHYWDIAWYEGYNQMVLWWDGQPVYIFEETQ